MNVSVIGNFGYISNQIDGQTVKTREIYSAIKKYSYFKADFVDLDQWQKRFNLVLLIIYSVVRSDAILFMPGVNALKFLSPLLIILCTVFRVKIYYIVVGGWFSDLAARNNYIKICASYFDNIFVELPSMQTSLKNSGISSMVLHNFRDVSELAKNKIQCNLDCNHQAEIRLVYYSRVMKEKGINEALQVARNLKNKNVKLDIFGQINDPSLKHYLSNIKDTNISYKGILTPGDEIYEYLSQYDYLLFPTVYPGEGYPGALVDSIISGVVPVVTDWKYNSEILNFLDVGFIFSPDNYVSCTTSMINNHEYDRLQEMKNKCYLISKKFYAEVAIKTISMVIHNDHKKI